MLEKRADILVIPENINGHDKIIGDLHGNKECLDAILGTLAPNDRLFLVGYVIAIVAAMSGWIYALGWAALKLIV